MATVRTVTFSEIMSLGVREVEAVIETYPSLRHALDEFAAAKAAKYAAQNSMAAEGTRGKRKSFLLTETLGALKPEGGAAAHTRNAKSIGQVSGEAPPSPQHLP
jgi:hypothetical protein